MALFRSRVVEVARPRRDAENLRTRIAARVAAPVDFRRLYRAHYDSLRGAALLFDQPGALIAAIDVQADRVAGVMCLSAKPGAIHTGIVGRHSACDLFLPDDPSLALRHLVVVVEPPQSFRAGDLRLRILDLHTGNSPRDEESRAVESLTAEGPVFLTLGRYALMAFPTGDATDWPDLADDGWRGVPERIFVEEHLAVGSLGSAPRPDPSVSAARAVLAAREMAGRHRTTVVSRHEGPVAAQTRLLSEGELAAGALEIASHAVAVSFEVGDEALRRGVLIGRYDRCHGNTRTAITSDRVSRVHLLVLEIAGRVWAVDLGSTNGSHVRSADGDLAEIRAVALAEDVTVALGEDEARVRWRAAR